MTTTKTYRFRLRGVHQLQSIQEQTHGHGAYLNVTLKCPIQNERQFLTVMKEHVLKIFDANDWSKATAGEPTGENVTLTIAQILKEMPHEEKCLGLELVETQKNRFLWQP